MTWHSGNNPEQRQDNVAWSNDQLARLESERRRLQRGFAFHPYVSVTPLRGDPPWEYQIDLRVTTLTIDPAGQLHYAQTASVYLWLTPGFPHESPGARPMTEIFHPNVSYEGIYLTNLWRQEDSLEAVIKKIGELLAYRAFDPATVANGTAVEWMYANHASLPLDRQADFSPFAGGEPLGRIGRYGGASMDEARQSLLGIQAALLGSRPPPDLEVREFVRKTRLRLSLFLERDVPEHLSARAGELDDAARGLGESVETYAYLRGRRATVAALRLAAAAARDAQNALTAGIEKLAGAVTQSIPDDPQMTLRVIPPLALLQPLQLQLPKLIASAERATADVKAQLDVMSNASPQVLPADAILAPKLETELDATDAAAAALQAETPPIAAQTGPLVRRANADLAALNQVVQWREYLDLAQKGRSVERQIAEFGSAGLQAYFMENASGKWGPFQFEQPLKEGGREFVVRSLAAGSIEVRDAATETLRGESKSGSVAIDLPAPAPEAAPFKATLRLSERCDDLFIRLDFVRRQVGETLKSIDASGITSESWAGQFCRLLGEEQTRARIEEDWHKVSRRWKATLLDLQMLGSFKERVSTYYLLNRAAERVPRWTEQLLAAQARVVKADEALHEIARKGSRDVEHDRLVVPARLAARYDAETAAREESTRLIRNITQLLKTFAKLIQVRLGHAKLLGNPLVPEFRVIAALPTELAALPIDDDAVGRLIVPLEEQLRVPLGGPRPRPAALVPPPLPAEMVHSITDEASDEAASPEEPPLAPADDSAQVQEETLLEEHEFAEVEHSEDASEDENIEGWYIHDDPRP